MIVACSKDDELRMRFMEQPSELLAEFGWADVSEGIKALDMRWEKCKKLTANDDLSTEEFWEYFFTRIF